MNNISGSKNNALTVFKYLIEKLFSSQISKTIAALLILCALLSIFRPATFFTFNNLFNIFRQASINTIMVVGISFVLITGGIDLSIGSVAGLTGLITAMLIKANVNVFLAISHWYRVGFGNWFFIRIINHQTQYPPLYYYPRDVDNIPRCD